MGSIRMTVEIVSWNQVPFMQMDGRNAISKPGVSEFMNHDIDQSTITGQ